jgi:hypothetical protein
LVGFLLLTAAVIGMARASTVRYENQLAAQTAERHPQLHGELTAEEPGDPSMPATPKS